ncbi:MAG: alpha-galactosidase [Eubacteriales bacterium]
MIIVENNRISCHTKDTTYLFQIMECGQLEHLYYGNRIDTKGHYDALIPKCEYPQGNLIEYDRKYPNVALETKCLEISTIGKGDVREPMVEFIFDDGVGTCDFKYASYEMKKKENLHTLPSSYDEENQVESIVITLVDEKYEGVKLLLTYSVFYESNVITRSVTLVNNSERDVTINRLLSCQLDLQNQHMPYVLTTFQGAWANEMNRYDVTCTGGMVVNDSKTGTSSNRNNPFVMISESTTTEEHGHCYGANLIYSGNHFEGLEGTQYGITRFIMGINPYRFHYVLEPGQVFEAPEAVLTYSSNGYGGVSKNMHSFVRNHIVRGVWKKKVRPILINSWEASYFNFNEEKLLGLAEAASKVGVELFVLDDGWFGNRNDDKTSLGDWFVNLEKLPNGLGSLAKKVNQLGMEFGIWVEPEMISRESECYKEHPEYAVNSSGEQQSLGRNQLIMDLTQEEVQDYIINQISSVIESATISYVKWDMNRIFTDMFSHGLSSSRQGEFSHRYILGLYRVFDALVRKFPTVLFEGCSAGGNRFDLGILCYMPQIWGSDNTDPVSRAIIQTGYSYGYPMSTIAAHVSASPNHQTLRQTPLETRFQVACFGLLGYECNLVEMGEEDCEAIKQQIKWYKKYREVLQFGHYHRLLQNKDYYQWMVVDDRKEVAIALTFQTQVHANRVENRLLARGLSNEKAYHFTNRQIPLEKCYHSVANQSESEDYIVSGSVLNEYGLQLKQQVTGTGYNEYMRIFSDYATRIYLLESIEK